ncbi:MAG TPA: protein translocase subunit SecF [Acidimicrobiales bacterium]
MSDDMDDMDAITDSAAEPERSGLRANLRSLYQCTNDFDFTRLFKRGLVIAVLVSVISIISLFTRGLNLGIDFKGGSVWEVPVTDVSVDDARGVMEGLGNGDAKIQLAVNADGTKILRVQADVDEVEASSEVTTDLADLAGIPTSDVAVTTVGPSWGDEISRQAQRALVYFFIAITLYISFRLEWKMAVGALVSMAHDLLLSVGVYSILQIEVTPATLISFLTILGYSLYDTIVVFDRALENSARTVAKTPYRVIMNRTLNQTLMRSVNTTVATILPIISMLIFGALLLGAKTLQEFGLALLVGLTSGAYSSLFVAAPIVSWLKEREPKFAYTGEAPVAVAAAGDGGSTARPARRGAPRRPATPAAPVGAIPPRPRKT